MNYNYNCPEYGLGSSLNEKIAMMGKHSQSDAEVEDNSKRVKLADSESEEIDFEEEEDDDELDSSDVKNSLIAELQSWKY